MTASLVFLSLACEARLGNVLGGRSRLSSSLASASSWLMWARSWGLGPATRTPLPSPLSLTKPP